MEITSMSNRELYKTLTGYDYPANASGNQIQKLSSSDSEPSSANTDRFEYSDDEYSDDMDFDDRYTKMVINSRAIIDLGSGIKGGVPTKERIAEYYGNMAKRLDTAYKEGKFTKEEYDYLNEGIAERMEHHAANAEHTAAFYAWGRARGSLSPAAAGEAIRHQQSITPEQWREERDSIIDELVERYYRIDRILLLEMFNKVRYGGSDK